MSQNPIKKQRDYLHDILESIDGVKKVYFQPPESIKLKYPCIIYSLDGFDDNRADGKRYLTFPSYTLTLIDFDPESMIQKHIMDLSENCYVSFNRFYTSDNLNHWVYKVVFDKALW